MKGPKVMLPRLRSALLPVIVAGMLAGPLSGHARDAGIPAAPPVISASVPDWSPGALTARYAETRAGIQAAQRAAAAGGHRKRVASLGSGRRGNEVGSSSRSHG